MNLTWFMAWCMAEWGLRILESYICLLVTKSMISFHHDVLVAMGQSLCPAP
jgi:hypothetical protein